MLLREEMADILIKKKWFFVVVLFLIFIHSLLF